MQDSRSELSCARGHTQTHAHTHIHYENTADTVTDIDTREREREIPRLGETGFVHQPQLLFEACYFQILSLLSSGSVKGKILVPVQRVMG